MARIFSETEVNGIKVSLETGRIAKQAGGAVIARIGDTMVLATACSGAESESDFFPLSVDYVEKTYGKIGAIHQALRKTQQRYFPPAVDRPMRPLFPNSIAMRYR